jgi:hypothetical protein
VTIASLIVDIGTNTATLSQGVGTANRTLESVVSTAKSVAGALGAAFSVQAVIGFAREIASFASKMLDLSAETGISTDRLQAFDYVLADVGLGVDAIVRSVEQLARRLIGDDKAAVNAVERLGLETKKLIAMAPDAAFIALAEAVARVENPMEKIRLSVDLFGKSGPQMLRIMKENLGSIVKEVELTGGIIERELLVKADAFDEKWERAVKRAKAHFVNLLGMLDVGGAPIGASSLAGWLAKMAVIPDVASPALAPSPFEIMAPTEAEIATLTKQTNRLRAVAVEAVYQISDEMRAAYETAVAPTRMSGFVGLLEAYVGARRTGGGLLETNDYSALTQLMAGVAPGGGVTGDDGVRPGPAAGMFSGLGSVFSAQLGPAILRAVQGGGSVVKSVAGTFGKGLTEHLFGGDTFKATLGDRFGKTIGGALGSVLPGIGALAGPAIAGLTKLFGGIFGGGEHSKVNDMRDQFIDAAGGLEALNQKAVEAGTSLDKLLGAKKVKDFESAVEDLRKKMGDFAADQEADALRLEEAIKKYGFAFEELGPKLQQQKLHEQATELIEDWRVLVGSGIEMGVVNEHMAKSMNEYLAIAIKTGAEVPSAMKPVIESMQAQGLLAEDLKLDQISWSQSMTEGFDRVVLKLDELIQRLQGAGSAIGSIPRDIDVAVNVRYNDPGYTPGALDVDDGGDMQGFAGGTHGIYPDFGHGTVVKLHGRERVMTEAEGRAEEGSVAALRGEVAGMRRDFRDLPYILTSALRSAQALG